VGHEYVEDGDPAILGDRATVRAGTIIYADVEIGDGFNTGHHALIREHTAIGDEVLVGTQTVIDGTASIGSNVSLQTGVYVPTETVIGDRVFLGPNAVLTNDPFPVRREVELRGPTLEDDVTVGANATVLPDVTIGERSFVAAGAVVTEVVPPDQLAVGVPARHEPLPEDLSGRNDL
jgi:acetyltransferase-like isoleucine patch superfamily enzyme